MATMLVCGAMLQFTRSCQYTKRCKQQTNILAMFFEDKRIVYKVRAADAFELSGAHWRHAHAYIQG
jgi:hypothetical protein